MIKHLVMWKLKEEAHGQSKEENAREIKKRLEALKEHISEIKEIEVGLNFETSDSAYDVALYSVFETEEGLHAYQVHPAHQEAAAFVRSVVESRVVVDYKV